MSRPHPSSYVFSNEMMDAAMEACNKIAAIVEQAQKEAVWPHRHPIISNVEGMTLIQSGLILDRIAQRIMNKDTYFSRTRFLREAHLR